MVKNRKTKNLRYYENEINYKVNKSFGYIHLAFPNMKLCDNSRRILITEGQREVRPAATVTTPPLTKKICVPTVRRQTLVLNIQIGLLIMV